MPESESEAYPILKPERRRRAMSRPNFSDRRTHERYAGNFPVDIITGPPGDEIVYHGIARDVSSGGLSLEVAGIPESEKRFRVSFRLPNGVMPEEFMHAPIKAEADVCHRKADGTLGLQFVEPIHRRLERTTWVYLKMAAVGFFILALCAVLLIKYQHFYIFWFDIPIFLYNVLVGAYLLTRFLFAAFYRRAKPLEVLPTMTVIVPVFNEEKYIERTLRQVMESAYPVDKLNVIVVNDGSTDKTPEAIERIRTLYPEIVLVNFAQSRGKRSALAAGVRMATTEIVTFIDSDSFLVPQALSFLVSSFRNPKVAAVTGHCDAENIWANLLTRMQAVRYYLSFRVIKAAESVFGTVTCLSGPIAAYRRDILMTQLDKWETQMFLGFPATFGDDRSLTNYLLELGHDVVYDDRARVTTIIPEDYKMFLTQQMRWKRSWFRESLRASAFMWKRQPLMSFSFYLGFVLPIISPFIVFRALILLPIMGDLTPFNYLLGVFLMSSMMSTVYLFARRSRLWLYGIPFCFFYMAVLVWQLPWAMITFYKSHWGTRGAQV
jgi:hyaluronan synthase